MRQYIIASHAHFATGIKESVELLSGARDNVHDLSMFVDGRMDVAEEAQKLLAGMSADDDVVVCTDLFGGSVNNEFTKIVQTRPNTYLVANMNLPLLIQLLFSDQEAPADQVIREILAADDTRVKFVNDLLTDENLDKVEQLRKVADELGTNLPVLSMAWILQHPEISCVIAGASKPSQLENNMKAAGFVIPADAMAEIDKITGFHRFERHVG